VSGLDRLDDFDIIRREQTRLAALSDAGPPLVRNLFDLLNELALDEFQLVLFSRLSGDWVS
jgi:hypothetical protein